MTIDCGACAYAIGKVCQRWSGGGKKAFDVDGGDSDNATHYTQRYARSRRGPCGPDGSGFMDAKRASARWDAELARNKAKTK